jgi:hypothetical protein
MAAPTYDPPRHDTESTEAWLLCVFALLIIAAMIPIGLVIAAPSLVALVFALTTVTSFAVGISYLLARMIGPQ